jgi:hypothetical protein
MLDVEFHKAGGEGAPFFNCYATLVESARLDACPEIQAMIASAAKVAKETGEAIEATLNAATIASRLSEIAIAERELEEAINAHRNSLALIRARKQHLLEPEGNREPAPSARVMEVAPPCRRPDPSAASAKRAAPEQSPRRTTDQTFHNSADPPRKLCFRERFSAARRKRHAPPTDCPRRADPSGLVLVRRLLERAPA